jgi:hypothetical protein
MPWLEKGISAPLDATPPEGRADLVGDVLATAYGVEQIKGKKYPLIHFSSGHSREFHASKRKPTQTLIHIFGAMHLPYNSDRDTDERMELLPSELRAILPPLYTNEKQEMEAVAPIKYFTPG